ncbi:ribosomal protein S19 family protein [Candidatus Micrarchaeota archaeon]|nr:ribosomal protein S19 family protein [Candidatus Micrarchaeota archaeon]MBI5177196.1 ribosomal protein S19 family protein [Candidatus Micrarchaeota archaeon]
MARKFSFHGRTAEEVKTLTLDEFLKLIPSKVRRTMRRMPMQVRKFIEKFRDDRKKGKQFKTTIREMVILPEMVDSHVFVYNGNSYVDVFVTPDMLGKRLGEFSHTTKMVRHSGPGIGATRGSKTVELK